LAVEAADLENMAQLKALRLAKEAPDRDSKPTARKKGKKRPCPALDRAVGAYYRLSPEILEPLRRQPSENMQHDE
jgi:hypothetical protein